MPRATKDQPRGMNCSNSVAILPIRRSAAASSVTLGDSATSEENAFSYHQNNPRLSVAAMIFRNPRREGAVPSARQQRKHKPVAPVHDPLLCAAGVGIDVLPRSAPGISPQTDQQLRYPGRCPIDTCRRLAELVAEEDPKHRQLSSERANVAHASFWIQTGMLMRKPPWHPMRFSPEQALRSRFRSAGVN